LHEKIERLWRLSKHECVDLHNFEKKKGHHGKLSQPLVIRAGPYPVFDGQMPHEVYVTNNANRFLRLQAEWVETTA